MNKVGGKFVLWLIIIGMLVFTAIRTVHFLQLTFPPDEQYVAYLGLAAFDAGVLAWFYFATSSAEGAAQRWVAYAMIAVCTGGVLATTIADMTIVSHENGLSRLPQDMGTLGLWAVIIVIVLNVAAGILAHLLDPGHQKHFEMQNAKDVIHATTMQHIKQQAHIIAPQIATQVSQYWASQVAAEMTGQIPGAQPLQIAPPSPTVVQGSGVALPQTTAAPQQPVQQDGFFARVKNVFVPQPPITPPLDTTYRASQPDNVMSSEQPATAKQERMFTLDELKTALGEAYDKGQQNVQPVDTFRKFYEDYKNDPSLRATIGFDTYLEQVEKAQKVNSPLQSPQLDTANQEGISSQNGHQK